MCPDRGGRPVISEPKTVDSTRSIPIDPGTVAELERWKQIQDTDREAWREGWQDGGWIFTREDGTPIRPDTYTSSFRKACIGAGVPTVTPHSLRHLAATLLLEAGVPTLAVANMLGHSSTRITSEVYQHLTETIAGQAVGRIADQLN